MSSAATQRVRPLLGTLVRMRCEGLAQPRALLAIEAAFAEIARIHALMSFHDRDSDLSRLHRAPGIAVAVAPQTRQVLESALRIAAVSDGCFDPTIAPQLVSWGFLPRPSPSIDPDPRADWRDIELVDSTHVRLARPLWIDLGGIAKGYAVDRALEILVEAGATQVAVEAGGDLRVAGPCAEPIYLRDGMGGMDASPLAEIGNGAFATSCGNAERRYIDGRWCSVHVDPRTRGPAETIAHACVAAPSCMIADALTKVVLAADEAHARRVLVMFGAEGHLLHRPRWGAAA